MYTYIRRIESRHRRLLCPSLYALNHPVSRFPFTSRWQPFPHQGLWSPPSKHNDSIHDPPCPHPLVDHEERYLALSLFLFSPISPPSVCLPFSLHLAKIIRPLDPRRREICGFSRDRLLYTVSFAAVFFNLLPTPFYLYLLVLILLHLLLLLLLCDRVLRRVVQREVDLSGANLCARVTPCCL